MMAHKLRVLIAKPGLDGHDRGAKVVAAAMRDAGFEVIYAGLRQTPEMIVETAIQEDVDVIALSILSGAHMTIFPKVLDLMKENGINEPELIAARHVRAYLAELDSKGLNDSTINGHARAVKTLVRFLYKEKYIPEQITFDMPSIDKKRLLVLSADDLQRVITACRTPRDKAIVLLIADSVRNGGKSP